MRPLSFLSCLRFTLSNMTFKIALRRLDGFEKIEEIHVNTLPYEWRMYDTPHMPVVDWEKVKAGDVIENFSMQFTTFRYKGNRELGLPVYEEER